MKTRAIRNGSPPDSFERFEYLARGLMGVGKRDIEEPQSPKPAKPRKPGFMEALRRFAMQHGTKRTLHCSFCGKSEEQVTYLLAGGSGTVYICGGCVDICAGIINKTKASGSAPAPA
ncbi:MAG TPA: ClpX C4-type zinc finger protein [Candidatus Binataceae bacterium]|nr:ClpX C4-type zinc finger protein [Candidatus Binataceae bacterium]